ncbi:hypothetical protein [Clostridium aciditolerans]|uniref:hypothetical protein n=1 Tax=Clostridium aciditolerans TaxID=339861 RepID=UPI001B3C57F9|nr:hypothetical protein [Clostridium aciditolerans]
MTKIKEAILKNKKFAIILVISLSPGFITALLVHFILNSKLSNYTLSGSLMGGVWNDQICYWLEATSFKAKGFDQGFFGINEMVKYSGFSIGVHGPFYKILIGGLAHLFNTPFLLGPVLNSVLIALSFIFFVYYTKIRTRRAMLVMVGIVSCWTVLLCIPTQMEESLNHAFAIALAAAFYRLFFNLKNGHRQSKSSLILSIVFITILSFLRPTWCFLIFVTMLFFCQMFDFHKRIKRIGSIIASLFYCAFFGIYMIKGFEYYPSSFTLFINEFHQNKSAAIKMIIDLAFANFKIFFSYKISNSLEIFERCVVLFFLLWILILLIRNLIQFKNLKNIKTFADIFRCLFHLYNLIAIICIDSIFYSVGNYYDLRIVAPHLLLSITIEIAFLQYDFIKQVLAINLIGCFLFLQVYASSIISNFPVNKISPTINISNYINYKGNSNSWRNTMLVSLNLYSSDLVTLPEGFGASIFIAQYKPVAKIKSQYLYLDASDYQYIVNLKLANLTPIYSNNGNTLYINNSYK